VLEPVPPVETEQHYTISEVAELWHLSRATVRSLFADVPGVLRIVRPETRTKRRFESVRIPARIVRSVHQQLTVKPK
jgi:hypothetical protein